MRTLRSVGELRAALAPARAGSSTIGLVPTMGALHEGHLSLIRRAREQRDVVVVSLFVNPAQFNEGTDLERYPRSERHDAGLAAEAGADLLFAPSVEEVYPPGFATAVEVLGLTDRLEGAARGASHFRGVTTVVTKLLCMTMPDTLYLGQKDAQQVVVIRRLVADLNLPVQIEALPTVREDDGLALSSRNALLDPAARTRALALHAALYAAGELAAAGERSCAALLDAAHAALAAAEVRPDYVALVDPATLEPLTRLERPALLAIAAHVGGVRLIDNVTLAPVRSGRGEMRGWRDEKRGTSNENHGARGEHRIARNVNGAGTATATTIGERRGETPCSA
jgi:pantoate--beta-alanine ligase